jgi:NAD/NADP transhydrogenase alpha subunit
MLIGIPAESRPGESRVAATAETVRKLVAARRRVVVESGAAGRAAHGARAEQGRPESTAAGGDTCA